RLTSGCSLQDLSPGTRVMRCARFSPFITASGFALLAACGGSPDAGGARAEDAPPAAPGAEAPSSAAAPGGRGSGQGTVPIEVTAVVGGRTYSVAGTGECTHTEQASIYDVRAAQWRAGYSSSSGDLRYLNLTIWQPAAGGADQANLSLRIGDTDHRIA